MNAIIGLFNLGGGEIILVLAIVLLLWGGKKLPQLARGFGQSLKEFKSAAREDSAAPRDTRTESIAPPVAADSLDTNPKKPKNTRPGE